MRTILLGLIFSFMLCFLHSEDSGAPEFGLSSCDAQEDSKIVGSMKARTSIRKEASLKAARVRKVSKGESGDILGRTKDGRWVKILFEDGTEGWVAARLVQITKVKVEPVLIIAEDEDEEDEEEEEDAEEDLDDEDEVAEETEEEEEEEEPKIIEQVFEEREPYYPRVNSRSLLAFDLVSGDLSGRILSDINERSLALLQKESGTLLVTQQELEKIFTFEKGTKAGNCLSNSKCIMDVAAAANADLIFGGEIRRNEDVLAIELLLIDVKKAEIMARVRDEAPGESALGETIERAVWQIILEMRGATQDQIVDTQKFSPDARVAVSGFQVSGTDLSVAKNIMDFIVTWLRRNREFDVLGAEELSKQYPPEVLAKMTACEGEGCENQAGLSIDVDYLVSGDVAKIEDSYVVNIRVADIKNSKLIGRVQESFIGPEKGLLPAARYALLQLFGTPYEGEGLLKIKVNVEGAAVKVNGMEVGRYPALELPVAFPVGKHRIEVAEADYEPVMQEVYVEPMRVTRAQFVMKEKPPEWWETWWFWTTVGVVVAGGVTTGVVLGLRDSGGSGTPAEPVAGTGNVILADQ